jgi:glucose-6-phosphate dehydrogenase assembly protein OpcA
VTTTRTLLPSEFGAVFECKSVERELHGLIGLAAEVTGSAVRRVHMSNVVVYCDRMETALEVAKQVPDIVAVHPARVILLIRDSDSTATEITAAVSVRYRPLERGQEVCSEQITLHAPTGLADRLPFLVRSFLIGDLPVNLWWSSTIPPPLAGHLLWDLGEHAQQVMYDSLGWTQPAKGMSATADWLVQMERTDAGSWRVASDLNWRRLKYWRRIVTQALDPASNPGAAETATELLVEHGPHAVIQAWELASWLTQQLGWEVRAGVIESGREMAWTFAGRKQEQVRVCVRRLDQGPPEVRRIRLACTVAGTATALNLTAECDGQLALTLEGVSASARTMNFPFLTPAEVVGRQLSDRERDPVFRESMAVAQSMAQSVVK